MSTLNVERINLNADGSVTIRIDANNSMTLTSNSEIRISGNLIATNFYNENRKDFRGLSNIVSITANTTLGAVHIGKMLEVTATGGNVFITIPDNGNMTFDKGQRFDYVSYGTANCYIVNSTGVIINSSANTLNPNVGQIKLSGRFRSMTVVNQYANNWVAYGAVQE